MNIFKSLFKKNPPEQIEPENQPGYWENKIVELVPGLEIGMAQTQAFKLIYEKLLESQPQSEKEEKLTMASEC